MAKDTKLNIVVDNTQANAALDETGKAVEELTEKTKGASKGTKKDWMGLTDLFSSVLPRSLQRSMRMFKSTGRSVGRLSKSFKFLKGAIASTGIGLLVIGLGELAANWDAIAAALSGVTEEEKRQEEAQRNVTIQQTTSEAKLRRYIATAKDATASDIDRTAALNKLAKAFPQLEGLEVGSLETNELINQAMADNLEMIKLRSDEIVNQQTVENKINAAREAAGRLTATELSAHNAIMSNAETWAMKQNALATKSRIISERKAAAEILFAQERAAAQQSQRDTDTAINLIQQGITDQIEEQLKLKKEGEDAERKAEAARKKRAQDRKNNKLFLANLEKELSEQILLSGIEDEQERAEKVLDIRHKELEAKAKLAGASKEQLKQIDAAHLLDLAELRESFEDDDTKIEDQAALREELRRADLQENEKDVQQAQDLYDSRVELAHGNRELEKEAEDFFDAEIAEIQEKWRKIKKEKDQASVDKEIDDAKKVALAKISSFKATANAAKGVFNTLEGLAEEGSANQKALAISGVLLSQAVAVANSIAGATAAGKGTGPAAPFTTPVFILQMVTHTLAAFAGIKRILNQADAATSGIGSGGGSGAGSPTIPLIPLGRYDSPSTNNQAYVVQSQLEGQNLNADQLKMQTVL